MKLMTTIIEQITGLSKWQKTFFVRIIKGFLGIGGNLTFRNMSRYLSMHEKTISRNFNKFFPFSALNATMIKHVTDCSVIAYDPFFVAKSGKNTEGCASFWNGCASKAERGLEFGLLAIIDVVRNIAYPLHAQQTRDDLKKEGESRIDLYVNHIIGKVYELRDQLNINVKYILVDAFFYKESFVSRLLVIGLHIVGKMRIDARLFHVYDGPQKARGRRKKYSAPVDWITKHGLTPIAHPSEPKLTLYTAIVHSVALAIKIRVVYLVKMEGGKELNAILYSTDLTMSALEILQHYRSRFQIEFVIRDAKQHTGLADCQSLVAKRLDFHINTSLTALNATKVEDMLLKYNEASPRPHFSMLNHKVRNHNEMMIQSFSSMLSLDLLEIKSLAIYEQLINIGTITYQR